MRDETVTTANQKNIQTQNTRSQCVRSLLSLLHQHQAAVKYFAVACLFSIFTIPCPLLYCQTETGTISGLVTDDSGAVISAADVKLQSVDRGTVHSATTNNAGIYVFPNVQPGRYQIRVNKAGFKQVDFLGLIVNVQDHIEQNFRLQVGSLSESVTVEASGLNINTTDASVSTVIDRQFVENLPLNGRSFQSLLYLTPGVAYNPPLSSSGGLSQGQFVVNGQRGDANYWMVDGVSGNIGISLTVGGAGVSGATGGTNALGGTSALVSLDAMQEFRLATSTYSPEFGRVQGGQISILTRSGTNQLHGTLFEYLRNTDLDATDWFANHYRLPKAAEIQNDFGGVLGGPIVKEKTFFFFSAEGLRLLLPETFLGTVPDMASRTAAIPAMQPYLNSYPLPKPGVADSSPGSGYVPYSATFSNPGAADAYSLRIDHQVRNNLNLFARYSHAPSSNYTRGFGAANAYNVVNEISKTATVGATWAKSTQAIDDLRFNYSVAGGLSDDRQDNFGGAIPFPSQGVFSTNGISYNNSNLFFFVNAGSNMNNFRGFYNSLYQHQYNLVDTLSLQERSHGLKFGVDYRRLSPSTNYCQEQLLTYFDNMSDLEQGKSYLTLAYNNAAAALLFHNLGLFAQDTWRVNSRLNLTYGLRWDVDFLPTTESGPSYTGLTGYSTTNLSNLALAPAGTPPYNTRYGGVAPRIGGGYQISTNPDWGLVVRGGFGVFYGMSSTEILNAVQYNGLYPFGAYVSFSNVSFPPVPSVSALPPILPPNTTNGYTLFGFDPDLNLPYALEWSVALEQSLGSAQTFSLSYTGSSDRRTIQSESIMNPNPNYVSALLVSNAGSLNYQALQAQFKRRLAHGLQALASYSWSHSIDTGSYGAYSNGTFAGANANRGDSDYDVRNAFSAAITYQLPVLKSNVATRAITRGWVADDVVQIRSGIPMDIQDANFTALSHEYASVLIRPDVVPGQPEYLTGPQYPGGKALNPASFTDPPIDPTTGNPLRQGNLGRNARRALGLTQWDFALHRDISIYDEIKLQFRGELFNVLNHPNFAPFNNQFQTTNPYFGQATQMQNQYLGTAFGGQNPLYTPGGPRSGELALKLVF